MCCSLCPPASLPCALLMDNCAACDAEAVVTALSVRYRFSRADALQLLRDQGILPQREAEEGDVEEAEDWESVEEEDEDG